MIWNDFVLVLQWWLVWLGLGLIGWPITRIVFKDWSDKGYIFAKAIGACGVTFVVLILTVTKLMTFSVPTILFSAFVFAGIGIALVTRIKKTEGSVSWRVIVAEEVMFLVLLVGWSFVKGHESTINGLEKFMDFGFTRSILQSQHMPPADMWYAGESINYYYFGHLMMAVTTKLSGLDLAYTFNIMLATIFALCFSSSFAIGKRLTNKTIAALFIAYLVTMAGNLHTIYAFTPGYAGHEDDPPAFWHILISPFDSQARTFGWDNYWYPNATRFIPYTIHEFPSYSFVVSDLHGHVLDIPLALIAIGFLLDEFFVKHRKLTWGRTVFFGWLAGMMFMTNALDGPIYLGLFIILAAWQNLKHLFTRKTVKELWVNLGLLVAVFFVSTLPFTTHFKSFVNGIAINCPPARLVNTKIGPLLFETVEKCQHSPFWMILILWGFFFYCCLWMFAWYRHSDTRQLKVFGVIFLYCVALILFAEFFYFKDIYPQHFRSNTMFKLGYQAFMMLAILSGYTITQIVTTRRSRLGKGVFVIGLLPLLYLVVIYPLFSVKSYFGKIEMKNYKGLYGLSWMTERYPENTEAISWLTNETKGRQPVLLEANGDSYTDADMISTFTGLPTVAGWTVHEWLWRDGYEPIANRAEEVREVYEATDPQQAEKILKKYHVEYLIVGKMERDKYKQINEPLLATLGTPVFERPSITVYIVK